jgi:hypothetical protein
MKYDVISHAKKVKDAADTICRLEQRLGKSAFIEAYRTGREQSKSAEALLAALEDSTPNLAMGVYAAAQDYTDEKRQLALNLLTEPQFVTITTSDPAATSIIRAIGLNEPLAADRILQPLIEPSSTAERRAVVEYDMDCSYLDDSELHDLSWDEFHRWYSTSGYIDGQIVARCLVSPVPLRPEIRKILDEVRMCYGFGQMAAIHGLCRTLIETALTDVCLRIGALTKAQVESDYFFKDFPPAKRITWTLPRGTDRTEAFALYTATSRVIHGSKTPEDTRSIVRRSIALVERLYSRHARQLTNNRNA